MDHEKGSIDFVRGAGSSLGRMCGPGRERCASAANQPGVCGTDAQAGTYAQMTPVKTVDPPWPSAFQKSCKKLDYNAYARNPDKYGMQSVYFTGQVVQVLEDYTDEVQMRIAVNEDYDKMMFVLLHAGEDRILEDDIVTVYGYTDGLLSCESTVGATITIPSVVAPAST